MKKILSVFLAIILLASLVSAEVMMYQPSIEEKSIAGTLMPDNSLYFLDTIWDDLVINSKTGCDKITSRLDVLEERMIEANIMARQNKAIARDKALLKHDEQLKNIEDEVFVLDETQKNFVSENLQRHIMILQGVLAKVPEAAKKGIMNAINNSQNAFDKTYYNITKEKRKSISDMKSDIEENERAAKKQTVLTKMRETK